MSAKSKDTTKTAHVMSLLRKNSGAASSVDGAEKEKPETEKPQEEAVEVSSAAVEAAPAPPSKPAPVQHPIIASLNEEAAVSLEIKDALERELMNSEPPQELASAPVAAEPIAPPKEEAPAPVAAPAEPVEPAPAPIVPPAVEVAPAVSVSESVPAPESAPVTLPVEEQKAEEPPVKIYNVMQLLVEESAEKYMKMFGVCDCPRCRADVRAIALNNLPPKYVVMKPEDHIPRITLYEQQSAAEVTAHLLRACSQVAESPRHDEM